MKLKLQVNAEGVAYLAAIDPSSGEHRKAVTVNPGQEVEVDLPELQSVDEIVIGETTVSESGETEPAAPAEDAPAGGEQPQGSGEQPQGGEGEAPTTSAASEKPLYIVEAEDVPDEFELSGLETPDGKELYHFAGDTAGQQSTGNVDGVSVYAEADDNEQPVKPAAATGENANSGAGASS